ncbi:MAG: zinc ABC transporter substrate-binding protein [Phycisphaeraceae bacterium]|nr:zinc ABC transporter substrate-binding protein [Phycisphaeraceae bacterium]
MDLNAVKHLVAFFPSPDPCRAGLFVALATMAILSFFMAAAGCGDTPSGDGTGTIRIVTTTGMIADVARQVAGDRAEVTHLIPSEGDPHDYVPTRADVRKLMNADVVFYNGLLLEGRMGDSLESIRRRGKPVIAVAEAVDEQRRLPDEDDPTEYDPHLWMDVSLWSQVVDVIAKQLAEMDPEHANDYRSRAAAYQQELAELHRYVQEVIATIPEARRFLITAHDAFGYFGRAYGIEVMGIQGISTESEAGMRRIEELVDLVVERRIAAIFPETSVSEDNIVAIIQGAAAQGYTLIAGQALFSDAMGPDGTYEGTYIGMIDHNATTITRQLGGNAPPRGFRDKLKPASTPNNNHP